MTTGSFPGGPSAATTGCAIFAAGIIVMAGVTIACVAYMVVNLLNPLW